MNAQELILKLELIPHPEGGYYKEMYRSEETMDTPQGNRNVCTSIYYLLENHDKSNFHRIKSDECWFFHQGDALEIFVLDNVTLKTITLGNDIMDGQLPQAVIPANQWFAVKVKNESGFALVSCTVAPGFDFRDFELAERKNLVKEFGRFESLVEAFTNT
jgi:predicted cupin superfamily sugar epimerase